MPTWTANRLRALLDTEYGEERVVVLANREPCRHDYTADGRVVTTRTASGLVTAIEPVVASCAAASRAAASCTANEGVWVAHGSGSADRLTVDAGDHVTVSGVHGAYQLRRVWLTDEMHRGYYAGFANEGLWPLCHAVDVPATFRRADFRHYEQANARFAAAAIEEARSHAPLVFVHDYHLALAPALVRRRLPFSSIVSFWHIPWPAPEVLDGCPWARRLVLGLLGSSVVGFQTETDAQHFLAAASRLRGVRVDADAGVICHSDRKASPAGHRQTLVRAYPIAIETPNPWVQRARPVDECRARVQAQLRLDRALVAEHGAKLIVGVDRLDYTKGLVEKCEAVERLLESEPAWRGRLALVQIAEPSRESLPAYRQIRQRVLDAVARVNARFGSGDYQPVVLREAHHEPAEVFEFLRAADVCYVGSLKDGMNLVAKEFVAARTDGRGALLLSRETGAAQQLDAAVLIDPRNVGDTAARLGYALRMSPAEQHRRMAAMQSVVEEHNLYWWAGQMLEDAAALRSVSSPSLAEAGVVRTAQRLSA